MLFFFIPAMMVLVTQKLRPTPQWENSQCVSWSVCFSHPICRSSQPEKHLILVWKNILSKKIVSKNPSTCFWKQTLWTWCYPSTLISNAAVPHTSVAVLAKYCLGHPEKQLCLLSKIYVSRDIGSNYPKTNKFNFEKIFTAPHLLTSYLMKALMPMITLHLPMEDSFRKSSTYKTYHRKELVPMIMLRLPSDGCYNYLKSIITSSLPRKEPAWRSLHFSL